MELRKRHQEKQTPSDKLLKEKSVSASNRVSLLGPTAGRWGGLESFKSHWEESQVTVSLPRRRDPHSEARAAAGLL